MGYRLVFRLWPPHTQHTSKWEIHYMDRLVLWTWASNFIRFCMTTHRKKTVSSCRRANKFEILLSHRSYKTGQMWNSDIFTQPNRPIQMSAHLSNIKITQSEFWIASTIILYEKWIGFVLLDLWKWGFQKFTWLDVVSPIEFKLHRIQSLMKF